jgi:segregation and condensation protein A
MGVPALAQPLDLELFEGPLDLLLTLLLREEIDLAELPLAELVDASLGPAGEDRHDPDVAGELVVLMAALAELKARRLLGEPGDEEPDPDALEARERLASRLVAGAPFRRAGAWLRARAAESAGPRRRRVPLAPVPAAPAARDDPRELAAALEALVRARPQPALDHLVARRVSLQALVGRLRSALRRGGTVSFEEHVAGRGRLEEAVALMAALELANRGEARLRQRRAFGDIAISPREGGRR